jgi:hypothetical protein
MTARRTPFSSLLRTVNRSAPWIVLALGAFAVVVVPQPPAVDDAVVARHARIEQVLSAVPLRVGEWIGEERPLAPAAVELLRPNAALSRSYRRIGEPATVALSLIHCSDFRDMAGHYPPVCYPAHGWTLSDGSVAMASPGIGSGSSQHIEETVLSIDGFGEFPVRCYRFSRVGDGLVQIKMTIFNAFILPDGRWVSDLGSIREAAARRRLAGEGVAQLQLVLAGWPSIDSIRHQCESLLSSLPSRVFEILGADRQPDSDGMESTDE